MGNECRIVPNGNGEGDLHSTRYILPIFRNFICLPSKPAITDENATGTNPEVAESNIKAKYV